MKRASLVVKMKLTTYVNVYEAKKTEALTEKLSAIFLRGRERERAVLPMDSPSSLRFNFLNPSRQF